MTEKEKEIQTPKDEKVSNPEPKKEEKEVEDEKSKSEGTVGEKDTEKKEQEGKPEEKKTNLSDFASEVDKKVKKDKFAASQSEAIRLYKQNEELKAKLDLIESRLSEKKDEPEKVESQKTPVDDYSRLYIKRKINEDLDNAYDSVASEYEDFDEPKIQSKIKDYTQRVMMKRDGIIINPITREPLTAREVAKIFNEAAILAGATPKKKEEQKFYSNYGKSESINATPSTEKGIENLTAEEVNYYRNKGLSEEQILRRDKIAGERRK